jgi:hypothetical protein
MSTEYVAVKFAALEEVVAVSAAFQKKYNATARLKLVLTEGKYRKPAITALGIGIFQQLCGFNSLSKSCLIAMMLRSEADGQCITLRPCSRSLVLTIPLPLV